MSETKKALWATLFMLILVAVVYAVQWDDTNPADNQDFDVAMGKIRDNNLRLETAFGFEHDFSGVDGNTQTGGLDEGAARAYYTDTAPTKKPDGSTNLDANDEGRLWIDSDDEVLSYRTSSAWSVLGDRAIATNVKDTYGAVGDGTVDDTNAIQNAINAALAGTINPNLYFPGGTYRTIRTLTVNTYTSSGPVVPSGRTVDMGGLTGLSWGGEYAQKVGIKFIGDGGTWVGGVGFGNSTQIKYEGTTDGPVMLIVGVDNFQMENMVINGTNAATANEGLFFTGHCRRMTLDNVQVMNCDMGMRMGEAQDQSWDPCDYYSDMVKTSIVNNGGWQMDYAELRNLSTVLCTIGYSSQTAMNIHCNLYNADFQGNSAAGDIGVDLHSGRLQFFNVVVRNVEYGINCDNSGTHSIRIYGGRGDTLNDSKTAIKYTVAPNLEMHYWEGGDENSIIDIQNGGSIQNEHSRVTFVNCQLGHHVQIGGSSVATSTMMFTATNCRFGYILDFDTNRDTTYAVLNGCTFSDVDEAAPLRGWFNTDTIIGGITVINPVFHSGAGVAYDSASGRNIVGSSRYTLDVNDTSPSVGGGFYFATGSGVATDIAYFDDCKDGQLITIIGKDGGNTTFKDNDANRIVLPGANTDIVLGDNDVLQLIYDINTTCWYYVSLGDN